MAEATTTIHHAIFPIADVSVTSFFLGKFISLWSSGWPHIIPLTIIDTINHVASVLGTILINHVSFSSFFVEEPLSSVTAITIGVNLNSVAVANFN